MVGWLVGGWVGWVGWVDWVGFVSLVGFVGLVTGWFGWLGGLVGWLVRLSLGFRGQAVRCVTEVLICRVSRSPGKNLEIHASAADDDLQLLKPELEQPCWFGIHVPFGRDALSYCKHVWSPSSCCCCYFSYLPMQLRLSPGRFEFICSRALCQKKASAGVVDGKGMNNFPFDYPVL